MHARTSPVRLTISLLSVAALLWGCSPRTPAPKTSQGSTTLSSTAASSARVRPLLKEPKVDRASSAKPTPPPAPPPPSRQPVPGGAPAPLPVPQVWHTRSATADPTETLLHNYQQALQQGFIQYNPPAEMTVGTAETIVVRVLKSKLPPLSTNPGAPALPGQTLSSGLSVYPRMRVALTTNSGAAFAITPDANTPITQTVPDSGFAEWRWQVAPLLAGPAKTLVVTAWADLSDHNLDPILIQEYEAEVNVQVAPAPPPPSVGSRVQTFLGKNWQWLWAAIVIPVLGWVTHRFSRKKKEEA